MLSAAAFQAERSISRETALTGLEIPPRLKNAVLRDDAFEA